MQCLDTKGDPTSSLCTRLQQEHLALESSAYAKPCTGSEIADVVELAQSEARKNNSYFCSLVSTSWTSFLSGAGGGTASFPRAISPKQTW